MAQLPKQSTTLLTVQKWVELLRICAIGLFDDNLSPILRSQQFVSLDSLLRHFHGQHVIQRSNDADAFLSCPCCAQEQPIWVALQHLIDAGMPLLADSAEGGSSVAGGDFRRTLQLPYIYSDDETRAKDKKLAASIEEFFGVAREWQRRFNTGELLVPTAAAASAAEPAASLSSNAPPQAASSRRAGFAKPSFEASSSRSCAGRATSSSVAPPSTPPSQFPTATAAARKRERGGATAARLAGDAVSSAAPSTAASSSGTSVTHTLSTPSLSDPNLPTPSLVDPNRPTPSVRHPNRPLPSVRRSGRNIQAPSRPDMVRNDAGSSRKQQRGGAQAARPIVDPAASTSSASAASAAPILSTPSLPGPTPSLRRSSRSVPALSRPNMVEVRSSRLRAGLERGAQPANEGDEGR